MAPPPDKSPQADEPPQQPPEQPPERPERPEQPGHSPTEHRVGESAGESEGYELAHVGHSGAADTRAAASARTAAQLDATRPRTAQSTSASPRAGRPHRTAPNQAQPQRSKKRDLTAPPRKREALTGWLAMLACLAVAALPLLVDLRRPAVQHPAEAEALLMSAQTWEHLTELSYDGLSLEPLVPVHDGQAQLDATPGTTWLHLLMFKLVPEAPEDTGAMIFAGRLGAVAMGLLTVAAVFWAGMSIGGLRTATLAALACAANPVLLYYSRIASPVMVQAAIAVLCVAAAVWAVRPLKMPGGLLRQALGWLLCGVCLGMALLTGGLRDLPFILLPLVLIFALYPHRVSHLMGLLAAVIIAALLATPWALYVHERDPSVWQAWAIELVPAYFDDINALGRVAGERLVLLVAATLPWTPWLVAGLLQPFSTSSAGSRLRMMLGWVWFVPVGLLLLGAPGHGAVQEMLIVLPAAALLVGQVLRQFSDLSDEGRHARIWRMVRWPFCFALMFASVAIPGIGYLQEGMIRAGWLPGEVVASMPPWYWGGLGALLLLTVVLSMRFCEANHPGRAAACWACWVIAAFTVVTVPVARGPLAESPVVSAGHELRQATAPMPDAPIYQLAAPSDESTIDPRLSLYTRRPMHALQPAQLMQVRREQANVLLLTDRGDTPGEGFHPLRELDHLSMTLWRTDSAAATTQPAE